MFQKDTVGVSLQKKNMRVTYNWLKDFVEIKIPARELVDKLTMAGLEVVSLEEKQGDWVLEIEITSNRPDWLSVTGIAREVAALTGKRLKSSFLNPEPRTPNPGSSILITIQDKKDCLLYTAKIIEGVNVAPSSDWLKRRLELIGCRSINNIVDITNYILFTYGEPLHVFDLDKLGASQAIVVRRAKNNETLVTIDGVERKLTPDILVIADSAKPIAIAGIMGGKDTEVSAGTKNILLEAAVFNPLLIRRGRQSLGLQTHSSYRFERGIDRATAESSSWQAVRLIQQLAGGKLTVAKSLGATQKANKVITLGSADAERILGKRIAAAKIKQILQGLGFTVKLAGKNKFQVRVPGFRQDVSLKEDLIEELSRVYGFENIPVSLPRFSPQASAGKTRELVSLLKNILCSQGLNEAITYSLVKSNFLKPAEKKEIAITNPQSQEQAVLRIGLISSLLERVAYNLNQKQNYIGLFEVASVFFWENNLPREELSLAIAVCGEKKYFLRQGAVKEEAGILNLKGILEACLQRLGIKDYNFLAAGPACCFNFMLGGENAGVLMQLPKEALSKFDIKNRDVFALELSLEKLFRQADLGKKYLPLPKFPGITRDISLVLKKDISLNAVLAAIKEAGQPLLRELKISDYYQGKQIPEGCRGLTISCFYSSSSRTLTEEEVSPVHDSACKIVSERFSAKIR
ncbi:MAG: phenylalanine--tRNA ligase subunit beta [Candidatus Omnitrophota bacterium]